MKRIVLLALAVLFLAPAAFAQHSATLGWQASVTPNAQYNTYRAVCTGTVTANQCSVTPPEAAWVKVNPASISGTNFTDATGLAGEKYVYRVKAVCPPAGCTTVPPLIAGESLTASNLVAATIPSDFPQPPTNLVIVSVALNHLTPKRDEIQVAWQSAPGKTSYTIVSNNRWVKRGHLTSETGQFSVTWRGKPLAVPGYLTVCASDGQCVSQTISL